MIDKISVYILDNFLYKNEKLIGDQRDIMLFGITRIIEDIPKYIFILIFGFIFKMLDLFGIIFILALIPFTPETSLLLQQQFCDSPFESAFI